MSATIKERAAELCKTGDRKVTDHGWTAELRTARKPHWCHIGDEYPHHCRRRIEPGAQYVRSVLFPNHDTYGYIDSLTRQPLNRPIAHDICLDCARNYTHLDVLAELADQRRSQGGAS